MLKRINHWRQESKRARLQKKLEKTSSRLQETPARVSNKKRSLHLTKRQAFWIKIVATVVLVGIMIAGFYVSFGTLVAFATMFGKVGEAAIIIALILDTLAVLGLGITLLFPSTSSKVAFLGGVGASSVMNVYIGWTVAGPVGAVVAVIPQLATVLGERVVFDLLFDDNQPLQEDTTEAPVEELETTSEAPQELEEELVVMDDFPEITLNIVEDVEASFLKVPELVEEIEATPVGYTNETATTTATKEEIIAILRERGGKTPGRPALRREFNISDWVARKVVEALKN